MYFSSKHLLSRARPFSNTLLFAARVSELYEQAVAPPPKSAQRGDQQKLR